MTITLVVGRRVQWNLRITDKLVHRLMTAIRRLSFIGGFLPKILYFTFLSATHQFLQHTRQNTVLIHDLKKSVLGLERYYGWIVRQKLAITCSCELIISPLCSRKSYAKYITN